MAIRQSYGGRRPEWQLPIRSDQPGGGSLLRFHACCAAALDGLEALDQARTRRGARARRGLMGTTAHLERLLVKNYRRSQTDILASLRGRSDDITMGRLHQQEEDDEEPVDTHRLPALLLLLLLWQRRHVVISDAFVGQTFNQGRGEVLRRFHRPDAPSHPETRALREGVLDQYAADIDRLLAGLRDGTPRGPGLTAIVAGGGTLGTVTPEIAALFDREAYRLGLFAESLIWTAWSEGYRAGAVDGTLAARAEGETDVPRFRWLGPLDARCCAPCIARFGEPIVADSVEALPSPQSICQFGRGCRHWWGMD